MFEAIAFYLFAFLTIVMFYITVTTSQALHALTALAAGMILISAFFFILGADFLGAVQIIVYSGAVMALYAFGMMFFDTTRELKEKKGNNAIIVGLSIIAAVLVVVIFAAPMVSTNMAAHYPMVADAGNTQEVGIVLFTKYLVPFELAAVMLLVAMVAGIVLAGKKMDLSLTLMDEAEIQQIKDEQNKKVLS
ncbi:MAG: NADH-quinone oxidoreductase subunit J [Epsilonproteobacteria bacterium]|nr:NADH-quinone oxidoreductase subunit J [Campylobacterota bacterium]OIO15007.1 MAG: NADH:ubiquinone oxidoreductase subunit J [Helicobacteraceae bacterium CG1_02_36_14]PIP10536.1 MAG: NADH:ubiquinone oxidoreductase subunit J [Sulfurimonas sp. CG23_combo_of_CG06-09_8_20_14_all_36_33]PIS26986.1 MAG: NADH:ubiquinone oxidoreductase subunit J [Sulfurimonas sp. CG08_land_8_20_14_0_20_36_33]PIU35880.1 MAG: NADH:ubiquinone oxidoreductase subunit J [Sulfurimonas sp. CG07_land_8_20_14_0_80_36_56]PIV0345